MTRPTLTLVQPPPLDGPERRAAMLAEAIRHTAAVPGTISASAIHAHLLSWAGKPEEECGGDIVDTLFFLSRSGLYFSDTPNVIGGETTLRVSRPLTAHLYDEGPPFLSNGDEDCDL